MKHTFQLLLEMLSSPREKDRPFQILRLLNITTKEHLLNIHQYKDYIGPKGYHTFSDEKCWVHLIVFLGSCEASFLDEAIQGIC